MRDILRRGRSAEAVSRERLLDVLATARKRHHLFAAVAVELPASVGAGDFDVVAERAYLARQFGAIHRTGEALRAIDLNRIEPAPCAIRPARHVGDDDVGVEMRIGTVAVVGTFGMGTFGRTCRDVVEMRGDDVPGEHPFGAALLTG